MSHILLADDDQMMRILLREVLEEEGYTVSEAAGGHEVIDQLSDNSYDLLLLDIYLSDITGWDVIRMAESQNLLKQLKLIVISGSLLDILPPEASAAHAILRKPMDMVMFLGTIKRVLHST